MIVGKGNTWELNVSENEPIATLRVFGAPDGPEAVAIGMAFVDYAKSIGNKPWAMVSDLRDMPMATREGQEQWVANMVNLMGLGLSRWAVINRRANAALQASIVAKSSQIQGITLITEDEKEALAFARGVTELKAAAI